MSMPYILAAGSQIAFRAEGWTWGCGPQLVVTLGRGSGHPVVGATHLVRDEDLYSLKAKLENQDYQRNAFQQCGNTGPAAITIDPSTLCSYCASDGYAIATTDTRGTFSLKVSSPALDQNGTPDPGGDLAGTWCIHVPNQHFLKCKAKQQEVNDQNSAERVEEMIYFVDSNDRPIWSHTQVHSRSNSLTTSSLNEHGGLCRSHFSRDDARNLQIPVGNCGWLNVDASDCSRVCGYGMLQQQPMRLYATPEDLFGGERNWRAHLSQTSETERERLLQWSRDVAQWKNARQLTLSDPEKQRLPQWFAVPRRSNEDLRAFPDLPFIQVRIVLGDTLANMFGPLWHDVWMLDTNKHIREKSIDSQGNEDPNRIFAGDWICVPSSVQLTDVDLLSLLRKWGECTTRLPLLTLVPAGTRSGGVPKVSPVIKFLLRGEQLLFAQVFSLPCGNAALPVGSLEYAVEWEATIELKSGAKAQLQAFRDGSAEDVTLEYGVAIDASKHLTMTELFLTVNDGTTSSEIKLNDRGMLEVHGAAGKIDISAIGGTIQLKYSASLTSLELSPTYTQTLVLPTVKLEVMIKAKASMHFNPFADLAQQLCSSQVPSSLVLSESYRKFLDQVGESLRRVAVPGAFVISGAAVVVVLYASPALAVTSAAIALITVLARSVEIPVVPFVVVPENDT